MAITASGFSGGSMTDAQFGYTANPGFGQWIETSNGTFAVTQPSTSTRTVSIATGQAVHSGVRVVNDAAVSQSITAPGSGSQWFMLVIRRDRTVKTGTLVVLSHTTSGSTTAPTLPPTGLPSTFATTLTGQFDQPLAWIWASSASTTLYLFDLRYVLSGGLPRATSLDGIALFPLLPNSDGQELSMLGTESAWGGGRWLASGGMMTPSSPLRPVTSGALARLATYVNGGLGTFYLEDKISEAYYASVTYRWSSSQTKWMVWIAEGTSGISFAGTVGNVDSTNRTSVQRNGKLVTWNIAVNIGSNGLSHGGIVMAAPTDYGPAAGQNFWFPISVYGTGGFDSPSNTGVAHCYWGPDGSMRFMHVIAGGGGASTNSLSANWVMLGTVTYRAID